MSSPISHDVDDLEEGEEREYDIPSSSSSLPPSSSSRTKRSYEDSSSNPSRRNEYDSGRDKKRTAVEPDSYHNRSRGGDERDNKREKQMSSSSSSSYRDRDRDRERDRDHERDRDRYSSSSSSSSSRSNRDQKPSSAAFSSSSSSQQSQSQQQRRPTSGILSMISQEVMLRAKAAEASKKEPEKPHQQIIIPQQPQEEELDDIQGPALPPPRDDEEEDDYDSPMATVQRGPSLEEYEKEDERLQQREEVFAGAVGHADRRLELERALSAISSRSLVQSSITSDSLKNPCEVGIEDQYASAAAVALPSGRSITSVRDDEEKFDFPKVPIGVQTPPENEHQKKQLDESSDEEEEAEAEAERRREQRLAAMAVSAAASASSASSSARVSPMASPPTYAVSSPSPMRDSFVLPGLTGCRSVDCYERLNKIDEGTYGMVFRARDKITGEIYALKQVKMEQETEGFPLMSLREIHVLLMLKHPNIVNVREIVVGRDLRKIYMVMEYMEHDMRALLDSGMKHRFSTAEAKCLVLQLLTAMDYLHDNWVLHRDLKTSNLLLNNQGRLKVCDFGMARYYGDPLRPYSPLVVTLWYRAPELLLGAKEYSTALDMWSVGCIMAELLDRKPLFEGRSEIDQLNKIFSVLGTPTERVWPGLSQLPHVQRFNLVRQPNNNLRQRFPGMAIGEKAPLTDRGFDLLSRLLTYDPAQRISAKEARKHPWFEESPKPKEESMMPTFPSLHERPKEHRRLDEEEMVNRELREKLMENAYAHEYSRPVFRK